MLIEFVEFIITELVEDRSSVTVSSVHQDGKQNITVRVSEQDFGRVIGKGGQTIRSIRSLISSLNKDKSNPVVVEITK